MANGHDEKSYLGRGLSWPLQVSPRGEIALASGESDIEQSIRIILGTTPGERVMRPEFGCRAYELVFAPRNASTEQLMQYYVEQALGRWEPRIEVLEVTVEEGGEDEGVMPVHIKYEIKATHDERSIVYPFFIRDEE